MRSLSISHTLIFLVTFAITTNANDLSPRNPFPNFTSGPHFINQSITPSVDINFGFDFPVNANEWYVRVQIFDESFLVYATIINGIDRNIPGQIIGDVNMSPGTPFIPTYPGDYTIFFYVVYEQDINNLNDMTESWFDVFGPPGGISNLNPAPGSTIMYSPAETLTWANGNTPITNTVCNLSPVIPNSAPVISSTLSDPNFNSFTPGEDLVPSIDYNLLISQSNPGGTTINGPFMFTTQDQPCSPPVQINFPGNGATDVLLNPPPNIQWTQSQNPDAAGYEVFLGTSESAVNPSLTPPVTNIVNIENTTFPVPENLISPGATIFTRIGTNCPTGTSYSEISSFTFGDRTCPDPRMVTYPANGSTDIPHSPTVPIELIQLSLHSVTPIRTDLFFGPSLDNVNPSLAQPITSTLDINQTTFEIPGPLISNQDYFIRPVVQCGDGDDQVTIPGDVTQFHTAPGTNLSGKVMKTYDENSPAAPFDSFFDVFVEIEVPFGDNSFTETRTAEVDQNGDFSFFDCPPGSFELKILAPPGWIYISPLTGIYQNIITPGENLTELNFILIPPPSEITGEKWEDDDEDGEKDQGENLIPGWPISLSGTSFAGNSIDLSTTTGSNGSYLFENVPPGVYTITEGSLTGWQPIYPPGGEHNINVDDGIPLEGIDFGNAPPGSIHGQKFHDFNSDGTKGDDEIGIDGVTIELYLDGILIDSQETMYMDLNSDNVIDPFTERGLFWFTNLLPGNYEVREVVPDGWFQTAPSPSGVFVVSLQPGQVIQNLFFGNNAEAYDFGDLPDPLDPAAPCILTQCYPTKLPIGAKHPAFGPMLGNIRDVEADGQPDFFAMGDDTTNQDEDGVKVTKFDPGATGEFEVTISGGAGDFPCFLNVWIDFNYDGFLGTLFINPEEKVISQQINAPGTYTFTFNVPVNAAGPGYARFRLSTNAASIFFPEGTALDGEVEDYFCMGFDYGDALDYVDPDYPDLPLGYPVRLIDNGARHIPVSTIKLGFVDTDRDNDGQPSPLANNDDNNDRPDEDGIEFLDGFTNLYNGPDPDNPNRTFTLRSIARGKTASFKPLASIAGFLNTWIDFNADGDWEDPGEQIFDDEPVLPGPDYSLLTFNVPTGAEFGPTFARFRFSTQTNLEFDGPAINGEVEDYLIHIGSELDFGDAPDPYPTLNADKGPKQFLALYYLGDLVDGEADGQPHPEALGDDQAGLADEDGVTFLTELNPGKSASVEVISTVFPGDFGFLNAWIDFNIDGTFDADLEKIIDNEQLFGGTDTLEFNVPDTAVHGETFARFRFTHIADAGPEDSFDFDDLTLYFGEVEDYKVMIDSVVVSVDQLYGTIPSEFKLHQNYPNPFNPVTTINFDVAKSTHVKLEVYNVLGQKVATLVNESKSPGRYAVEFGTNNLPSGIYIYQIEMDDYISTMKMILMK